MTIADTPFQVPPRFIPVGKWLEKIDVHPLRGKGTKFHQFGQRLLEKRFLILDDLDGINEEHLKTMFTEDEMEMVAGIVVRRVRSLRLRFVEQTCCSAR